METYVTEVKNILYKLTALSNKTSWQYTDQQIIEMFEILVRQLHEGTDMAGRAILYQSTAWRLRETNICTTLLVTAHWPSWFRRFSLEKVFTSLGQTSDFHRWFPSDEPFWDDDDLSL